MELKKVVMPGVKPATAQPVQKPIIGGGIPTVKPPSIQQVVKPTTVQMPVQTAVQTTVQTVKPSITEMPKEDRIADVKSAAAKVQIKATNKKASDVDNEDDDEDEEVVSKPVKKKFTGPRKVVVYGRELFVEEDPKVSLDDIRERIVNEYEFPEFAKERTQMSLDEATGIVVPVISFQKKG